MNGAIFNSKAIIDPVDYGQLGPHVKDILYDDKVNSYNIFSQYIGDCLTEPNYSAGCCLKLGKNTYYLVENPWHSYATSTRSGIGHIRKFNTTTNTEDKNFKKDIEVGHGNSIAYDSNTSRIYIAPVWNYSGSSNVNTNYLLVYDTDFNYIENCYIDDVTPTGVSFDHVTKILYCYSIFSGQVYKYENNSWIQYSTIDFTDSPFSSVTSMDQDFAVYNNRFYLSSTSNKIVSGLLEPDSSKITKYFQVSSTDGLDHWRIGEIEGFEFTEEGQLISAILTKLDTTELSDSFVVNLNIGTGSVFGSSHMNHVTGYGEFILLNDSSKNKFTLHGREIRSLTQLSCITNLNKYQGVTITQGSNVIDPYEIHIHNNINLVIDGNYTCIRFIIENASLHMYSNDSNNLITLTGTASLFSYSGHTELAFAGSIPLNMSTPNITSGSESNFINPKYSVGTTTVRILPVSIDNKEFYIGQSPLTLTGRYIGQGNLEYYGNGQYRTIATNTSISGIVGYSKYKVVLTLYMDKPFLTSKNPTITSGAVRIIGPEGDINNDSSIDLSPTSSYSISVSSNYHIINITISSSNPFNISTLRPVTAYVSNTIVLRA